MAGIGIIFPHQLFEEHPLTSTCDTIYLVEEWLFFKQYHFHQQKIAFHRASMQCHAERLQQQGHTVHYIEANEPQADVRNLIDGLHAQGIKSISMVDPVDDWLMRRVRKRCTKRGIGLTIIDSPMFLLSNDALGTFFKPSKKKFFQTEFYKQQRIERQLLMDANGAPNGGQWTYDVENRKRYPKGKAVVPIRFPAADRHQLEARAYTQQHFAHHPGTLSDAIIYPTDHETAAAWLEQFLEQRLHEFGDYEDAIVQREAILNHSLLTPMLNVGLLTPQQVIDRTLHHAAHRQVPINSLEGFIRQIVGWREFIRGVYVAKGGAERSRNFWGFTRKIPNSFYDGTTGILPVDVTIRKVLRTGYCHHIERLMVLGNFMLLCEFDPDEVYRWFMELFIDAYDWVMVPNVYGMSQFADGGLMSTKPYISGSNYLMKMSDYPKGEWQETWDALFWHFMDRQRAFFLSNPRMGMLIRTFDGWDAAKQAAVRRQAQAFLKQLDADGGKNN